MAVHHSQSKTIARILGEPEASDSGSSSTKDTSVSMVASPMPKAINLMTKPVIVSAA